MVQPISGSQPPPPDPKFGGDANQREPDLFDGKVVATKKMERTLPMILQWDEKLDIGSDTLTGVNDADYLPPFALIAKLSKLTISLDRPQPSPADIERLGTAMTEKAKAE